MPHNLKVYIFLGNILHFNLFHMGSIISFNLQHYYACIILCIAFCLLLCSLCNCLQTFCSDIVDFKSQICTIIFFTILANFKKSNWIVERYGLYLKIVESLACFMTMHKLPFLHNLLIVIPINSQDSQHIYSVEMRIYSCYSYQYAHITEEHLFEIFFNFGSIRFRIRTKF